MKISELYGYPMPHPGCDEGCMYACTEGGKIPPKCQSSTIGDDWCKTVRLLSPMALQEVQQLSLATGKEFSEIIDELKPFVRPMLDKLIESQPIDVQDAILEIVNETGGYDADWPVLLLAGQLIAKLRAEINAANPIEIENNIYRIFRRIERNYELLNELARDHGTPEQQIAFKEAVYGSCMALSVMLSGDPMKRCRAEEKNTE